MVAMSMTAKEPEPIEAPRDEGAREVDLDPERAILPAFCACCLELAAFTQREQRGDSRRDLLIPYCGSCQRHASAPRTRTLAVTLASSILALTLSAFLSLIWPAPLTLIMSAVLLVAAAPIVLALVMRRRPRKGHSASGKAAFWSRSGSLVCSNARWAAELALTNHCESRPSSAREPKLSPWMSAGSLIGLSTAPFFYSLHHPLVRVVNLTDQRLVVFVDGREFGSVEPSSTENPAAGVELHLPAGERDLVARPPGRKPVFSERVQISVDSEHLFAPGSRGQCFWLETTGYGRTQPQGPTILALTGDSPFWPLPIAVDHWFLPNPPPEADDGRSTGGVLTTLRQAPCGQAPDPVRNAEAGAEQPIGKGQ